MDIDRKRAEPSLVCTCSSLYIEDIQDSIDAGWDEPKDIMTDHATQFRCTMCKPIIQRLINSSASNKPGIE